MTSTLAAYKGRSFTQQPTDTNKGVSQFYEFIGGPYNEFNNVTWSFPGSDFRGAVGPAVSPNSLFSGPTISGSQTGGVTFTTNDANIIMDMSTGPNVNLNNASTQLQIGLRDFTFDSSKTLILGFAYDYDVSRTNLTSTYNKSAFFFAADTSISPNWLIYSGTSATTSPRIVTSVPISNGYTIFRINIVGSSAYYYINNVLVSSQLNNVGLLAVPYYRMLVNYCATSSGLQGNVFLDAIKLDQVFSTPREFI